MIQANALRIPLPSGSVHCVITSPPYLAQRDYGAGTGEIGQERTLLRYLARMRRVFREVWRILRDDGVVWLVIGDKYANDSKWAGFGDKNLMLIPFRMAIVLQNDGWVVRRDVIWRKPNGLRDNAKDRPDGVHEYIFLLSKQPHYWSDFSAIEEPKTQAAIDRERRGVSPRNKWRDGAPGQKPHTWHQGRENDPAREVKLTRNVDSVWTISTRHGVPGHYAAFPPELVERCVKSTCPPGGVVFDPFLGSGTTAIVARNLGRRGYGIDLSHTYCQMARDRMSNEFGQVFKPAPRKVEKTPMDRLLRAVQS